MIYKKASHDHIRGSIVQNAQMTPRIALNRLHLKCLHTVTFFAILAVSTAANYKLSDRVFVLPLNATGGVFTIASVPEVQNETYSFRGDVPVGLQLNRESGVITITDQEWHNNETSLRLNFTVTSLASQDDLDVQIYRVERGPYSTIFKNSPSPITVWVPQWIRPNTPLYKFVAIDAEDYGATVSFQLESGASGRFTVDSTTGDLKVLERLPFDPSTTFTLAISAQTVGTENTGKTITQVLTVKSGDVPPQFSQSVYTIDMNEFDSSSIPTENDPVFNISVLSFYDLSIKLTLEVDKLANDTYPANKFRLVKVTKVGSLTTASIIPAESVNSISALNDPRQHHLTLKATEDVSGFTSSAKVTINVVDINDHTPMFLSSFYTCYDVAEDEQPGTSLLKVTAIDLDEGDNALLSWEVDNDSFEVIGIDNTTAEIKTKSHLDYDNLPLGWYEFNVTATDAGNPPNTGSATVRVWIKNTNNKSPVFDPPNQVAYVRQKLPGGNLVHVVQAHDPDAPDFPDFTFSFRGQQQTYDIFQIDANTGHITLIKDFPENKKDRIQLPVTLNDNKNPIVEQSITIDIMGINRPPRIPNCKTYKPTVLEGQPPGTDVIEVTATDEDSGSNGELVFQLALPKNQEEAFEIVSTGVNKAMLRTTVQFNREEPSSGTRYYRIGDEIKYPVTVEVLDNRGDNTRALSTTCFFLVTIGDINNNSPVFDNDDDFKRPPFIKKNPAHNEKLFRAFAYDRDLAENGKVEYELTNGNCDGCLRIDAETGYIYRAKDLTDIETMDITATIEAKDKGTPQTKSTLNITLSRTDTYLPPTWLPVEGTATDIDDYTMNILEDSGPTSQPLNPIYQVSEAKEVTFLVREGSFPENNFPSQFDPVGTGLAANATRIRKTQSKQTGGRDPLKYIRLRAFIRQGPQQPYADKRLKINFEDVNLNTPEYTGTNNLDQYPAYISTESLAGYLVTNVFAVDEDASATYNTVSYYFKPGCEPCADFTLDKDTGEVTTNKQFDTAGTVVLEFFARDGANENFETLCDIDNKLNCYRQADFKQIVVTVAGPVLDRPYFIDPDHSAEIEEGFNPGKEVTTIKAAFTGRDSSTDEIQHNIISGNDGRVFAVEPVTGKVYQVGTLDFSKKTVYTIEYGVFYGELANSTSLQIKVKSKPCLKPYKFTQVINGLPEFTKTLEEEAATPSNVATLPLEAHYTFTLSGPLKDSFKIEGNNVNIAGALDRDFPKGYREWQVNVEAVCSDTSPVPEDATRTYAMVRVQLTDINDNSPVFSPPTLYPEILENQGTVVGNILAVDYDEGVNAEVIYDLLTTEDGNLFNIGENTGLLTAKVQFDREAKDSYRVIVRALDRGQRGKGSVAVQQYVWITIGDINDNPPVFPGSKSYEVSVPENQPIGASVISVFAEDEDIGDNARRDYSIVSTQENFVMDSIYSSGTGVVKIKQTIDYEAMDSSKTFSFKVQVQGPEETDKDTADVTIQVTDVNDNAPVICPVKKSSVDVMAVKCSQCAYGSNVTVVEGTNGLFVAEFMGCDEDSGQNAEFSYLIDYENTDQEKNFLVMQKGDIATITLRKALDRERSETHVVHLLAIDKGSPPLTGTATLTVTVGDINDNAPEFSDPEVQRVVPAITTRDAEVGTWDVTDRDGTGNRGPFTVTLDGTASGNTVFEENFRYQYDGSTERLKVFAKQTKYNRTATLKRYIANFNLKDSGTPVQETIRELVVEIEDINDHKHSGATKYTTVYRGLFNDMNLGHFYVADVDDWDRTEKTYTLVAKPDGFSTNPNAAWELMMKRGVDPTQHTVTVDVNDKWGTARSTVQVDVNFLYDAALYSSGSVRFQADDLTPESFIERPNGQPSKLDVLKGEVTRMMGGIGQVHVFNLRSVEGMSGAVDVYYTVGLNTLPITYLRPSRLDGTMWMNKESVENILDNKGRVHMLMAPVNDCPTTSCWNGTCHNKLVIVSRPVTVDANVTSLVGIDVIRQPTCTCATQTFPAEPEVCTDTTCLNGGTCQQTWANANCTCPEGFEGPRCQKLKHSFQGSGWAWFDPLYLCNNDLVRFATSSNNQKQLLMYNGPLLDGDHPAHLIIELEDGYPKISVDMGSGSAQGAITGQDNSGSLQQPRIDDSKWHTIEVYKVGHTFRLVVDHCNNAVIDEVWNTTQEDRKPCEVSLVAPGDDLHVTFSSPLQLGGRSSKVPMPTGFTDAGLNGCIKDFFHNGEIYDLYVGKLGQAYNTTDDCPSESINDYSFDTHSDGTISTAMHNRDSFSHFHRGIRSTDNLLTNGSPSIEPVGLATLPTQTCEGDLVGGAAVCTCLSGKKGHNCTEGTVTRDYLDSKAYLEWDMNGGSSDNRNEFLQISFRSRNTDGLLFFAESDTTLERCYLQISGGHLSFTFDLGSGDKTVVLPQLNVSDGLWHTSYVRRHGNQVTLAVDGGEGRYYNHIEATDDFRLLMLAGKVNGGAAVTYRRFQTTPDLTNVMEKSYITDVRFSATRPGDQPLAMTMSENPTSAGKLTSDNTASVSIGAFPDPPCDVARCHSSQTCLDVWRLTYCGCLMNQTEKSDGTCADKTDCSVVDCGLTGTCVPQEDETGKCYFPPPAVFNAKAGIAGSAMGIIIGALLLMLLLLLLSTCIRREKEVTMAMLNDDELENHMREQTVTYEVEGAGEELPSKTDFKTLLIPVNPPIRGPQVMAYTEGELNQKNAGPAPYDMADTINNQSPRKYQPRYSEDVSDLILRNKAAADDDENYPADLLTTFEHEGSASLATSLSSLQSTSSGGSADQDHRYLSGYGPSFAKLADLYGTQDASAEEDEDDEDSATFAYPANVLTMNPEVNPVFAAYQQQQQQHSPLPASAAARDDGEPVAYDDVQYPLSSQQSTKHLAEVAYHAGTPTAQATEQGGDPGVINNYAQEGPIYDQADPRAFGHSESHGSPLNRSDSPRNMNISLSPNKGAKQANFESISSDDSLIAVGNKDNYNNHSNALMYEEQNGGLSPSDFLYPRSTAYSPTSSSSPPHSGDYYGWQRGKSPAGKVRFDGVDDDMNGPLDALVAADALSPTVNPTMSNVGRFHNAAFDEGISPPEHHFNNIADSVLNNTTGTHLPPALTVDGPSLNGSDSSLTIVKGQGVDNKGYHHDDFEAGLNRWRPSKDLNLASTYQFSEDGESNV